MLNQSIIHVTRDLSGLSTALACVADTCQSA